MTPKAFEQRADVSDVSRGVGVEDDDVVEVGGDAIQVLDDFVDDLDEPPGRGVAASRHEEAPEESRGGEEGGEWYGVLVDGSLVEQRHKVEQGKNMRSFIRESRTSSTRGMGNWPRELMASCSSPLSGRCHPSWGWRP